jgi:hypothetical protein
MQVDVVWQVLLEAGQPQPACKSLVSRLRRRFEILTADLDLRFVSTGVPVRARRHSPLSSRSRSADPWMDDLAPLDPTTTPTTTSRSDSLPSPVSPAHFLCPYTLSLLPNGLPITPLLLQRYPRVLVPSFSSSRLDIIPPLVSICTIRLPTLPPSSSFWSRTSRLVCVPPYLQYPSSMLHPFVAIICSPSTSHALPSFPRRIPTLGH